MEKSFTCVTCPIGCELHVEYEGNNLISVSGNSCKRGAEYAKNEIVAPVRTLTTTVRVIGGEMPLVPVKTSKPIPKGKLFDAMKTANAYIAKAPISNGDVLVADFVEKGVNLVACREIGIAE